MKRLAWVAGVLALAAGIVWVANPAGAGGKKDPTIKDVMKRAHQVGDGLLTRVNQELEEDEPVWPEVQKCTKELVSLGGLLGKFTPPRGEKSSWERNTAA